MIRESIDEDSEIVCDLLLYTFTEMIVDEKNFDFIKKRELKFLKRIFKSSKGYYVFNLDKFNHQSGFGNIDFYFDYAIRNVCPNKKLYEKLEVGRDDIPYRNRWALIFGTWKYYNKLKELSTYKDLNFETHDTTITIKLDSVYNYFPKSFIKDELNKSIRNKNPKTKSIDIPVKKVAFKYLTGALKLIAKKTDNLPELKNPSNQKKALSEIYDDLETITGLKWHGKPELTTLQKDWIIFKIDRPSEEFCSVVMNNNVLKEYPELEEYINSVMEKYRRKEIP